MLITAQSSSPEEYGRIRLNLDIPWKCPYIKYFVSSINTKSNILRTTNDDYLLFKSSQREIKIQFKDTYNYSISSLVSATQEFQTRIVFEKDGKSLLVSASDEYELIEGTHRAKLVTGLYNTKKFVIPKGQKINVPELPILDLSNKLYLISLQGMPVSSSINGQEYTPSVIANIDTMVIDGEPLIVNYETFKPIKIKVNTDSLKYLELSLVDFMYQPVVLKSPLFVTIKIKPAKNADIKDILTK